MSNPEMENGVHPRLEAEVRNSLFQEQLAEFQLAMEMWEMRVEACDDDGAQAEMQHDAINELDALWPHHGDRFFISGKWWRPDITINIQNDPVLGPRGHIDWYYERDDVFTYAISEGVAWRQTNNGRRIGFCLSTGDHPFSGPLVVGHMNPSAIALPEEISMELISLPSKKAAETHEQRIVDTVELYDKLLDLCLSRPEFFEQRPKVQQRTLERLLEEANAAITAPGTYINVQVQTKKLFQRTALDGSDPYQVFTAQEENTNYLIEGMLLGVTMLDKDRLHGLPLRSINELTDPDAGLCLLIEGRFGDQQRPVCIPAKSFVSMPHQIKVFTPQNGQ